MGRLLAEHLKIFTVETTLNNDAFPAPYGFLIKREWEWSLRDQATMLGGKRGLAAAPEAAAAAGVPADGRAATA